MIRISRNEKSLLFGRWSSKIGNLIFDYANIISIVSINRTNPFLIALYQSSETIIAVLFNMFGGAVADGNNRKKLLVSTDLLSALVCFVLSFLVKSESIAYILIVANGLLAIIKSFNAPTYKSIVREMLEKDRIVKFNSISNVGTQILTLVSPIVALSLVNLIGVKGALIFNAITFLLSALAESLLVSQGMPQKSRKKKNVIADIREGFIYLLSNRRVLNLILISAFANFFFSGYNLLVPYTNVILEQSHNNFYSKVLVAEAVGGLLGALLSTKTSNSIDKNIKLILIIFGISGFFINLIPLIGNTTSIIIALTPFLAFSIIVSLFNIQFYSYIQVRTNEEYLGRVFSIISTLVVLFMPLGSFFFSKICSVTDLSGFYIIGTGIMLLAFISVLLNGSDEDLNETISNPDNAG